VSAESALRRALHAVYGIYAYLALAAIVLPLTLLLLVVPGVQRRREHARHVAQLFFHVNASPIRTQSSDVAPHYPCVVVANHSSYLDGLILTAALPAGFTYLIKHEMSAVPLAGLVLRRLGSAFVRRDDTGHRTRVARELVGLAVSGDALAFFPEGTFERSPGLRPFQLGAFSSAMRAGLPVVPVVIQGARHKLPSQAFLPAPGPLTVTALPPLDPRRFANARELMQAVRAAMLRELGEPDLAPPDPARLELQA
jgi:1-acyl-sn-glycerol-3-phosphate acyltransferase